MRLSEQIEQYVVTKRLVPTWKSNETQIAIRAGDIHRELNLSHRMPAVCSILGSEKFQKRARIRLVDRKGPHQGANAIFAYSLEVTR